MRELMNSMNLNMIHFFERYLSSWFRWHLWYERVSASLFLSTWIKYVHGLNVEERTDQIYNV